MINYFTTNNPHSEKNKPYGSKKETITSDSLFFL